MTTRTHPRAWAWNPMTQSYGPTGALASHDEGLGAMELGTATFVWGVLSTASMAVSAYHGYKRHEHGKHPVAWALLWGGLGALFPVITPVVAVAEGYGKPKGR